MYNERLNASFFSFSSTLSIFISLTHNSSIKLKRCCVSFYFSPSTLNQHVTQLTVLSDDIKDRQDSKWTQIEQFNYLPPVLSGYLCCASLHHRKQLPDQLFLPICRNSRPHFLTTWLLANSRQVLFLVCFIRQTLKRLFN